MQIYNCLAIEPDSKNRMILKQAMSLVAEFNHITLVRNDKAALELLRSGSAYDLIFISDRFDKNKISQFIKKAKEFDSVFLAGYILLTSTQNDARTVAKSLLQGIDGVLIEPYSIDSLQELSLLAAKVKEQREEEKRKIVLSFLASNVIYCVDIMAQAIILSHSANSIRRTIKRVNESILSLGSNNILELYLDILSKSFMKVQKPVIVVQECRYKGTSERVKKIAQKDVIDKLENKISKIQKDIESKGII